MSCSGMANATGLLGGCSMIWVSGVILFFIIVFSRKWIGEAMGIPFSSIGAFVLGYLAWFIGATLTCSHKWALFIGVVAAAVGAFFGGQVLGDSGDGGY